MWLRHTTRSHPFARSSSATACAKHILIEVNHFHSPDSKFLHDVYECDEYPNRQPIPLLSVGQRIGTNYVEIDPKKIVGVVDCNIPEEARAFIDPNEETTRIGQNVVDFFLRDMKAGHIPSTMFPIQSGVGTTGNAVLKAIGRCEGLPPMEVFSEVVQDAVIELIENGKITQASAAAMTCTNECIQHVYDNIDFFSRHLTLRPSELSNAPELIRRFGVIAMNTALGRLGYDVKPRHLLDVLASHLGMAALRHGEPVVEATEDRQRGVEGFLSEDAKHLLAEWMLGYAIEMVKSCLRAPADVECGGDMGRRCRGTQAICHRRGDRPYGGRSGGITCRGYRR